MDDTPYVNDGADASLRKTVSLLNKIEAKTGSATITGPVTVTNEVEIKNDANNPLPVSDNNGSLTVDGTVELGATSLSALENIQVTFPSTQNVSVQNSSLSVTGTVTANTGLTQPLTDTQLRANAVPISGTVTANTGLTPLTDTQLRAAAVPVSLASVPSHPVTGPLTDTQLRAAVVPVSLASVPSHPVTASGSFTAAQATAANLNATVVGSGSFTAAQSTASNLKAQAQLLNASGSVVDYAMTGTAGSPASDVVTVQGIVGGTTVPVSLASVPSHPVTGPLTNTELRASAVPVSLASVPSHPVTGPLTNTELRATAVPVSGTVTANTGLSQPLTDTQLRATAVPVSGTVTSRIADGTGNNLTSAARGSERALSVQIVDASGAQVTSFGGGGGGGGTVIATQTTPSALKAQAQILDATGSQMSFVNAGIAGTPSVDVLTVQGSTSGTPIPVRVSAYPTGNSITISSFTLTSSSSFAGADSNRKLLTVFNEGNGVLYIKPGSAVSSTDYQIRMSPGDYWEVPAAQVGLQHFGIFASVGTARITSIS